MRESDFRRIKPSSEIEVFFAELQTRLAQHPALHHPFLLRFSEEKLGPKQLSTYAIQHYMYSRNFVRNLAAAISNTVDENARSLLILNMYEEIGEPLKLRDRMYVLLLEAGLVTPAHIAEAYGEMLATGERGDVVQALMDKGVVTRRQVTDIARESSERAGELTHPALFRRFLRALGIAPTSVDGVEPIPETRNMVEEYRRVCREEHWLTAMGAMGPGTECVVPTLYRYIEKGIIRSGALTQEDYIFWTIHIHCDDGHGANIIDAMKPHAGTPENRAKIVDGAQRVLDARKLWFDGLDRLVFG